MAGWEEVGWEEAGWVAAARVAGVWAEAERGAEGLEGWEVEGLVEADSVAVGLVEAAGEEG